MKVIVNGNPINLKIDYRFNGADKRSIDEAFANNVPIRHITRIKLYYHLMKDLLDCVIQTDSNIFMCNNLKTLLHKNNSYKHYDNIIIQEDILPEFTLKHYNKITKRNLNNYYKPIQYNKAWDNISIEGINNRIMFLKEIINITAIDYLTNKEN